MKSVDPVATPLRCLSDLYEERVHNFRVFDYKDLKDATKNFYRALKLGEGGFGIVYKGILKGKDGNGDDGSMVVAVKRLKPNALQVFIFFKCTFNFLNYCSFSIPISKSCPCN